MAVGVVPPYVGQPQAQVGTGMVASVYCDVALQLDAGQSISPTGIVATLTEQTTGAVVTGALAGSPAVSGTRLVQTVTGSALAAGHAYWLTFTYAPTPPDVVGEQMMAMQPVVCGF
jgi:hypothetical protein